MSEPTPIVPLSGTLLDLDAYRQKRTDEGTWPIPREEHFEFFRKWRERKERK